MNATVGNHLPSGREGTFFLEDFQFESGELMAQLRIGYVAYGHLNSARDNLLLLLPGTGNTRHSALGHVGPGRAYDSDRYCVVCTDAIGGGSSSQPADGLGAAFPRYSIRDMVRAQHALVRDGLGLGDAPIGVLAGASMGAFQALEWLVGFPRSARSAVLLVPGWRAGNIVGLTTARMFEMIALDRRWAEGAYTAAPVDGMRTAGRHYFPWTVSDDYLSRTSRRKLDAEAANSGEWFTQWDAWNLIRRYQASTAHDVTVPFGGDLRYALSRVDAEVLVMPCAMDRLLGLEGALEIARGIDRSRLAIIDSHRGHLAWRAVEGSPETNFVTAQIRRFLDLPPSSKELSPPSGSSERIKGDG